MTMTIPSLQRTATTVPLLSTALAAYSIWNTLPSDENVVTDKSYPVPMLLISQLLACSLVLLRSGSLLADPQITRRGSCFSRKRDDII